MIHNIIVHYLIAIIIWCIYFDLQIFENIYLQNKIIWIVKLLGKSGSEIKFLDIKIIKIGNLLLRIF